MSSLRQLFMLQFDEPYFLDTNWHFGFNLFDQQRYYLGFTRQSKGGSLTWGYLLTDNLRMLPHLYLAGHLGHHRRPQQPIQWRPAQPLAPGVVGQTSSRRRGVVLACFVDP